MSKNLSKYVWMIDAECRDSDIKMFTSFDPALNDEAKKLCKKCKVQKPCLLQGHETPFVVAGMTRYERLLKLWHRVEDWEESNFD